jgi:hypothetical protein
VKRLAAYAWLVVLGTALAVSWWSLDALGLRFGMPKLLAGMVSATFDGAALVAAELALRRAAAADSAAAVKLLMVCAVGLAGWLNYEHGLLLGYPIPARVLFAAPSVISGWLFELQLRTLRSARVRELGKAAPPLPRFGFAVWLFHPVAALRHVSRIAHSRLRSVPVTVMDWDGGLTPLLELGEGADVPEHPVILAAPVDADDECADEEATKARQKAGRSPVPDELYLAALRKLVEGNDDEILSAREIGRRLSIGQDRARRLLAALKEEQTDNAKPGPTG